MDEKDRLLLICLQSGLPLIPRPFDVWATKIGTDNAELLVRIQRLKKEGSLSEIKAILDPRVLRYQSAWVAMRLGEKHQVSPEDVPNGQHSVRIESFELDSRTGVLWQHPGVIYGCEREHEFNIWFFITVPEDHDLELHVRCLEKRAVSQQTLLLPVRKVFKGTDLLSSLDAGIFPAMSEHFEKRQAVRSSDLKAEEIGMIRQLQEPFPATDEPYKKIAADLGITEAQALERIKALAGRGFLRRIGSYPRPATAVPVSNMLVVWQIPEERLERIGPDLAEFHEVLYSDCRPSYPEFPYSFYTIIRAVNAAELEGVLRRIQDRIGKWPYRTLETVRELKKEKMKYFPKELDAWWRENRRAAETAFNRST